MLKKDMEGLPKIEYTHVLGNPLKNQRGALKFRKVAKNALTDFKDSMDYLDTKQKVEEEIERYRMRQDLFSFRNVIRQQNHS
jgi:hypothetical protein